MQKAERIPKTFPETDIIIAEPCKGTAITFCTKKNLEMFDISRF